MKKIPVILDTDIGNDVDDVWALVMLLKSPEVDIKLITTDSNNTIYRARLVAKLLDIAGRTDIPIGVGIPLEAGHENHADWLEGYQLSDYPGEVMNDGVGAIVDTIMHSAEPITLLCIGPVPNIAAALQREPCIAEKCRFVGMYGSLRIGYDGRPDPVPEFNVYKAAHACQMVFSAEWPMVITPLDTCGLLTLTGENFQQVAQSKDPLVQALIALHHTWKRNIDWPAYRDLDPNTASSILFDCVAVHLVYSEAFLNMEELGVRVTNDGRTIIDPDAKQIRCATSWTDQAAFERYLTERLVS